MALIPLMSIILEEVEDVNLEQGRRKQQLWIISDILY
jgi:hypothetical protein